MLSLTASKVCPYLQETVIEEASAHLVEEPVHRVEPGIVGRHGAPARVHIPPD